MSFFEHEGFQLYYSVTGNTVGNPVVFIHGYLGSSNSHWGKQLTDDALKSKYMLIATDLRGYGKSKTKKRQETHLKTEILGDIEFLLKNVIKLQKKVILVGYSVGAALALEYTLQHPKDVAGIVLLSPRPFAGAKAHAFHWLAKEKRSESKKNAYLWNIIKFFQWRISKRTIKKNVKKQKDYLSGIKKIQIPILFVTANQDSVTPPEAFQILLQHLPTAKQVTFEGDHGISHEQAVKFNQSLIEFFNNIQC